MNTQALRISSRQFAVKSPACRMRSFAAVLRCGLGEYAWSKLEPAIGARFSPYLSEDRPLHFIGTMQWVYCSPFGAAIARIVRRFSILPDTCARDTEFDFIIGVHNGEILKQRCYELGRRGRFTFTSLFREQPRLHEEFGGGIGMYLGLTVNRGALLFRDRGYFLRIGRWRLPLPRWLTVGRFELLHRNIDERRFQIIIRVAHPFLGTLFYQRGEFRTRQSPCQGEGSPLSPTPG